VRDYHGKLTIVGGQRVKPMFYLNLYLYKYKYNNTTPVQPASRLVRLHYECIVLLSIICREENKTKLK
jgi:hypothetical protein